jgi:hypothetical protein
MMTKINPIGDPGGRSNPTNRVTPVGGGLKVTSDPQRNPVSIIISQESYNIHNNKSMAEVKTTHPY